MTALRKYSCFLGLMLFFLFSASMAKTAHAQLSDENGEEINYNDVVRSIQRSQQQLSTETQAILQRLTTRIQNSSEEIRKAMIVREKERIRDENGSMPGLSRLISVSQDASRSSILTDEVRKLLNDNNYKVSEGYFDIPNVGSNSTENIQYREYLATTGKAYDLHLRLFCNPAMTNAPAGCGSDRALAGINGDENFVDFMLSERTWPTKTVLDTMQLARLYFFDYGVRPSAKDIRSAPVNLVKWQQQVAGQSVRMSMLNMLAARRAPTSPGTQNVLKVMLESLAVNGQVSSVNYKTVCSQPTLTQLEAYVCNYTNIPDPNDPNPLMRTTRIISQASMDRILQYDYYLSPNFYATINSPSTPVKGGLDRMEVLMMAQQLSQDYYFLRMLQMKAVASSMNTSDKMISKN